MLGPGNKDKLVQHYNDMIPPDKAVTVTDFHAEIGELQCNGYEIRNKNKTLTRLYGNYHGSSFPEGRLQIFLQGYVAGILAE